MKKANGVGLIERAFNTMNLPLGGYQQMLLNAHDLGTQFTKGGTEPRTLVATFVSPMGDEPFTLSRTQLLLSEEAQRYMIAALQANLDDDQRRARELIVVFHPEYGEIT